VSGATVASSFNMGRISAGPNAQLSPIERGFACLTLYQNASLVCPDKVRPEASVMVPEIIIRIGSSNVSDTSSIATSAALALSVSNTVSTKMRSAPPSIKARVASA
jgi:hypothetical protein